MNAIGMRAGAEPREAGMPHRLLWTAGIAAGLLSGAAFLLWVLDGAGLLLDAIAAFCS